MKSLAIIGVGQIGSRHLQALAKIRIPSRINVIDRSESSLNRARDRLNEIQIHPNIKNIEFGDSIDDLDEIVDFCIVSTDSRYRFSVLKELLAKKTVKYLLLEKVLFQSVQDCKEAQQLLETFQTTVWVNCPLRMYPFFGSLKTRYDLQSNPIKYSYSGGEWIGLACNSIHYIDHTAFLSNSNISDIDVSCLDMHVKESKRSGFIEFTGTLKVEYENGAKLTIQSISGSKESSSIKICNNEFELEVDELSGNGMLHDINKGCHEKISYTVPYQSNLTNLIVEGVFRTGNCGLVDFSSSNSFHISFLKALHAHYKKVTGIENDFLPIT